MPALALRKMSQNEERQIEGLEKLSLGELEADFATGLGDLSEGQPDPRATQTWIAQRKSQLKQAICHEGHYCDFIKQHRNARFVEIVGALSDVIASVAGGVPVYTLSTLLIREGLDAFCDCS